MKITKKDIIAAVIILLVGFGIGWLIFAPKADSGKDHDKVVAMDAENKVLKNQLHADTIQLKEDSSYTAALKKVNDSLFKVRTHIEPTYVPVYASIDNMTVPEKIAFAKKWLGENIIQDQSGATITDAGLQQFDSTAESSQECADKLRNCNDSEYNQELMIREHIQTEDDLGTEITSMRQIAANFGTAELSLKDELKKKGARLTWVKIERDILVGVIILGAVAHWILKTF